MIDKSLRSLLESDGLVALGVALIALVGVSVGAALARSSNERNIYINSITTERSRWIDKIRNNISEYISELLSISYLVYVSGHKEKDLADKMSDPVRNLARIRANILLQLNPRNVIDADLVAVFKKDLPRNENQIELHCQHIIEMSQWLLKVEWEKVKHECRTGLSRFLNRGYRQKLESAYQAEKTAKLNRVSTSQKATK